MPWDTLHEAVRCAVAHRYDWPLPIAIIAEWEETGRPPGPARYGARPAGSSGTNAAVFSLALDDLITLAPLLDDFTLLDEALDGFLQHSGRQGEADQAGTLGPSPLEEAVASLGPGP